jgi:hypothetical protein
MFHAVLYVCHQPLSPTLEITSTVFFTLSTTLAPNEMAYVVFLTSLLTKIVWNRNNNLLSKIPNCSECILRMFRIQFCVTFKMMPLLTSITQSTVTLKYLVHQEQADKSHAKRILYHTTQPSVMARCPAITRPWVIFRPYPAASYRATSPT